VLACHRSGEVFFLLQVPSKPPLKDPHDFLSFRPGSWDLHACKVTNIALFPPPRQFSPPSATDLPKVRLSTQRFPPTCV